MNKRIFALALLVGGLSSALAISVKPAASNPLSASAVPGTQAGLPADDGSNAAVRVASACDVPSDRVPLNFLDQAPPFFALNFQPFRVEETSELLIFRNNQYSFTLCRADRTWSVQSLVAEDWDEGAYIPPLLELVLDGLTYGASTRLDIDETTETALFELMVPGRTQPISTVLYDGETIREKGYGAQAGYPAIVEGQAHDGTLWWAMAFEQAEGFSGVATIVKYVPGDDRVTLYQPDELGPAQMTDMVITGQGEDVTLWLGTKYTEEGNPYSPARGLVAYQPEKGTITSYTTANSPLVGAIPFELMQVNDRLWVATGNGVCDVPLQTPDQFNAWDCWRFTAQADLSAIGVELYDSLLATEPAARLTGQSAEVLWVSASKPAFETDAGRRYEVRYDPGFETTVDRGAWQADFGGAYHANEPRGLYWPGAPWHWNGERFVRSHDEIALSFFGGGPSGIGPSEWQDFTVDWNTLRGDFDLLSLTNQETQVRYYSGWVEASVLSPYVVVVPSVWTEPAQPNPLFAIRETLPVEP
ncbi:MAG: hypothetical protein AAFN18_15325 [Cyanobacteria bacterium J06554_6]